MHQSMATMVSVFISVLLLLLLMSLAGQPALADDPSGFCDQFATSTLDPGWTWQDPSGDCDYSLSASPEALQIHAPMWSAHCLPDSAPRVLQQITGDFVVTTKAACTAYGFNDPTAGILVYQDDQNYIGNYVGEWPRVIKTDALLAGVRSYWDSGTYGFNSGYLKVIRSGLTFTTQYSLDGLDWQTIAHLTYPATETVWVGLYVTDWWSAGVRGVFDYFEVAGCIQAAQGTPLPTGPSIEAKVYPPATAPGGRFPVKWVAKGGSSVSETYLLWDTSGHEYRNDYAYSTPTQSGGMDTYVEHLLVPEGAEAVYFKPYAVIDGETVYGPQEYRVSTLYALNVGGDAFGLDGDHQYWHPDRESDFSPVWYEFWGDDRLATEHAIANTDDDWIYQTQRQGMSQFSAWLGADVHEATLEIGLHLAEFEAEAAGERVFDIIIEPGTPNEATIPNVDVYALAGGQDTAVVISRTVKISVVPGEDEHLNIVFEGQSGTVPILNGLTIRGIDAIPMYKVTRRGGTEDDDTYTAPTGTNTGADEVWLGGNEQYHGGLRFPALHIPEHALIRSATLGLTASADGSMTTTLDVFAHAHDSSPSFAYQAVVPNRPRTSASVPWIMGDGDDWLTGRRYTSPDLAPLVQEVVDRDGWRDANAVSLLLIAGQGDISAPRKAWAYEGSMDDRAGLTVHYSRAEDLPTPTPTPVAVVRLPMVFR